MTLPVELTTEIQKLAPSAIIELFEFDATALGGEILRFHAGTNELNGNIVWNGETYLKFPIQVTGFEYSGKGQFPRPKITVSNALSAITAIMLAYNDLLDAKFTRKRTLKKFLDAENFTGGINAEADPTAEFENDIFYIDRKSHEDRNFVEFELRSAFDVAGASLPRRKIVQNVCPWAYRGSECGFTGAPVIDENDDYLTTTASALGLAVIAADAALRAATTALATAETELAAASASKSTLCELTLQETQYSGDGLVYGVIRNFITGVFTAYWNSVPVTLGATYVRGEVVESSVFPGLEYLYHIERWAADAGCAAASTAYTTALATRDTAQTTYTTAASTLATALDDLPDDDDLYREERCGKRLASCKARFGENNPLPFGAFPSVGLIR